MSLRIAERTSGFTVEATMTGIIDQSTLAQFHGAMHDLIRGRHAMVRVDLSGLLSWSSEARSVLREAVTRGRLYGRDVVVSGLPPVPVPDCDDHSPQPTSGRHRHAVIQVPGRSGCRPGLVQ